MNTYSTLKRSNCICALPNSVLLHIISFLLMEEAITLNAAMESLKVLQTLETENFPSPSSKRKHLTLHTCIDEHDLPVIAYLLESSPYLETLHIEMDSPYSPQLAFPSGFIDDDNHHIDETIFWTS